MQPKKTSTDPDLFRSRLDQIIDMNRPLVILADQIDWEAFEKEFGSLYVEKTGRPGLPIRLMVGLTYLERLHDLSDEAVVEMWVDNPYWQYFCGYEFFQHRFPLDPSSLVRWRKRIGEHGMGFLLQHTLLAAQQYGALTDRHLDKVNVDTTVQEKEIRFPTDPRLYHRMLETLVKEAKSRKIKLRQSYVRLSKRALIMHGRYSHARQMKRAARETRRLKTMLGRVYRDIQRKAGQEIDVALQDKLQLAQRLLLQQRHDKQKLYSVHETAVECIAKGKAHKKYEFGNKVGIVTTSRDNWVVGALAFHGNPYDGHTLAASLAQVKRLTGLHPGTAYVDQGYRGHGYAGPTEVQVVGRGRKRLTRSQKRWRNRRAAVEPVIGHLKTDHGLSRNRLHGTDGDRLNVLLAACGQNLRKLLQIFLSLVAKLLKSIRSTMISEWNLCPAESHCFD